MMELPPLEPFSGDWNEYIDRIYDIYCELVLKSNLRFRGLPVRPRFTPESQGKIFGFWHVTSEGKNEEERTPDLRRCERIRWISWIIENVDSVESISWWEEWPKPWTHDVVLWLEEHQFVLILSERRDYWLLKTAYLTNNRHKIKALAKNRENYWRFRKS